VGQEGQDELPWGGVQEKDKKALPWSRTAWEKLWGGGHNEKGVNKGGAIGKSLTARGLSRRGKFIVEKFKSEFDETPGERAAEIKKREKTQVGAGKPKNDLFLKKSNGNLRAQVGRRKVA